MEWARPTQKQDDERRTLSLHAILLELKSSLVSDAIVEYQGPRDLPLEVVVAGCGAEGSPSPAAEWAATHASYVALSDNDRSSVNPPSPMEVSPSSAWTVVVCGGLSLRLSKTLVCDELINHEVL